MRNFRSFIQFGVGFVASGKKRLLQRECGEIRFFPENGSSMEDGARQAEQDGACFVRIRIGRRKDLLLSVRRGAAEMFKTFSCYLMFSYLKNATAFPIIRKMDCGETSKFS